MHVSSDDQTGRNSDTGEQADISHWILRLRR